jgi:hypothetical protein
MPTQEDDAGIRVAMPIQEGQEYPYKRGECRDRELPYLYKRV